MAFKSVKCRASQSSSFGHLELSPHASVTITLNCTLQHEPHPTQRSTQQLTRIMPNYDTALHVAAVDKALDTWYNTGVGFK